MSKLNWGIGLKRSFIALSAIYWVIALAVAVFSIGTTWEEAPDVPKETWSIYEVRSPDGNIYLIYGGEDVIPSLEAYLADANKGTAETVFINPSPPPTQTQSKPQENTFDPTTAKAIAMETVISEGVAFVFPPDTPNDTIKAAISKHLETEANNKLVANIQAALIPRIWVLFRFAIGFGVIFATILTVRWIVRGFKSSL
ncbi:hypothetical protein [Asticcacaulis endophyticus]|nr:hypothetical protein [Asticcacaulis endophyticus]